MATLAEDKVDISYPLLARHTSGPYAPRIAGDFELARNDALSRRILDLTHRGLCPHGWGRAERVSMLLTLHASHARILVCATTCSLAQNAFDTAYPKESTRKRVPACLGTWLTRSCASRLLTVRQCLPDRVSED